MKKFISVLLACLIVTGVVWIAPVRVGAETYGDYSYGVISDGTVYIIKYKGSGGDVSVPGTIDGKSVTIVGSWAFGYCTSLTSITIPDSVTSIGERTFSGCTSLTSITIPDSVTSIGDGAFFDCTSLASITIPDSVTSIGYDAFYNCTSLTSITIPDSVSSIGGYAFYNCTALTIYGKENSYAQTYALNNNIPFEAVEFNSDTQTDISSDTTVNTDTQNSVTSDTDSEITSDTETDTSTDEQTTTSDTDSEASSDTSKSEEPAVSDTDTDTQPAVSCENGHKYKLDSFVWSSDNTSAKAVFVCKNNAQHTTDVDAVIESKTTKQPTCEKNGTEELTATAELNGETYTEKKTSTLLKTGHDYEAVWDWPQNFDNTVKTDRVTVTLTCKNDPTHTATVKAKVTETPASESDDESTIKYSGVAVYEKTKYTDTVTVTSAKPIIYGDVDGDEDITSNDALLILRASSDMIELNSPRKEKAADFDRDGTITSNDALAVLRKSTQR